MIFQKQICHQEINMASLKVYVTEISTSIFGKHAIGQHIPYKDYAPQLDLLYVMECNYKDIAS